MIMDFSTVKELRDAGFPQEPRIDISGIDGPFFGGFYYVCPRDLNEPSGIAVGEVAPKFLDERQVLSYSDSDYILVKIPQLDELITACGPAFTSLYDVTGGFRADGSDDKCDCDLDNCTGWRHFQELGPTAKEAVARLWLAHNKK